jgi:hypothetical protein
MRATSGVECLVESQLLISIQAMENKENLWTLTG